MTIARRLSLLCFCATGLLSQTLQITSPASGATVDPGQSVTISVTASGAAASQACGLTIKNNLTVQGDGSAI